MIRIRSGNLVIECEGEDDLRTAMRVLGTNAQGQASVIAGTASAVAEDGRGAKLREFIARVRDGHSGRVLFQLAKIGGAVKDSQLLEALRLESNANLAGSIAGLSKQAKSVGLEFRDIVTRRKSRMAGGIMRYTYRLKPDIGALALAELRDEIDAAEGGTQPVI